MQASHIAEHAQMAQLIATEADLAWQSDAHYTVLYNTARTDFFVLDFTETHRN